MIGPHAYVAGLGGYCSRCNADKANRRFHPNDGDASLDSTDEAVLIRQIVTEQARTGVPFTMNDIRPKLATVKNKNKIGDAFRALKKSGVIADTRRTTPSTDPKTKGHEIKIWIRGSSI